MNEEADNTEQLERQWRFERKLIFAFNTAITAACCLLALAFTAFCVVSLIA